MTPDNVAEIILLCMCIIILIEHMIKINDK